MTEKEMREKAYIRGELKNSAFYDALVEMQGGGCYLCKCENASKRHVVRYGQRAKLYVDHDHTTHCIRGLICSNCNVALGAAGDSAIVLRSAVQYLLNQPREYKKSRYTKSSLRTYYLALQQGDCAICKLHLPEDQQCVDHDHLTDYVRGVLCQPCNQVLGFAGDNIGLLAEMADYVSRDWSEYSNILYAELVKKWRKRRWWRGELKAGFKCHRLTSVETVVYEDGFHEVLCECVCGQRLKVHVRKLLLGIARGCGCHSRRG